MNECSAVLHVSQEHFQIKYTAFKSKYSTLGPVLFNVYTNDLDALLKRTVSLQVILN